MGLIRRINKQQGEVSDDANILGLDSVKGSWIAPDIHAFIQKFLNLKRSQKPYVFRPWKIPKFCTTFDFDFRFREHTVIPDEEIILYAQKCIKFTKEITGKEVEILVTRKEKKCYQKSNKSQGDHFASGCHFYFLKHRFTKSEATAIRERMNKEVLTEKLNFLGVGDVIDTCVFPFGKTGVYMLCSPKPGQALRHELLAQVTIDDYQTLSMEGLEPKHIHKMFKKHIIADDCYISTNEVQVHSKEAMKLVKKKKVYRYPLVENFVLEMQNHWNFNLEYFFDSCEGFESDLGKMDAWKDVCYFLKETNIPTKVLCEALNSFYKPDNPNENFNLIGKNREPRTSTAVYDLKRVKFWERIEEIGLTLDYWKLFFPQRFDTIQDVYGLCGRKIVWETPCQHLGKLQQCFSEILCFDQAKPLLHYKYRRVIGRHKTPNVQLRVSHTTNQFADKYIYYKDLKQDKKGSRCLEMGQFNLF